MCRICARSLRRALPVDVSDGPGRRPSRRCGDYPRGWQEGDAQHRLAALHDSRQRARELRLLDTKPIPWAAGRGSSPSAQVEVKRGLRNAATWLLVPVDRAPLRRGPACAGRASARPSPALTPGPAAPQAPPCSNCGTIRQCRRWVHAGGSRLVRRSSDRQPRLHRY